jgi:hypothetical protein
MNRKDYKRALDLLRTSQGLEPGRGKLLNIALCEEQLGQLASAWKHFQEVAAQLPPGDDRAPIVKQHLDAIGPKVAYVRITLAPGAAPGATVTLDGAPARPDTDLPVDPGPHLVAATAPGATERTFPLTVAASDRQTLVVAPQAGTGAAPPDQGATHGVGFPIGVAAVAVGGASLLAGVGTGAAAIAQHASTVKHCPTPSTCPAGEQPAIDTYNRLGAASTAMWVIGGALAVTGVVLVLTSRPGEKPPAAGSWVGPLVGPGLVGVQGRFW